MTTYELGTLAHLTALELRYDVIPETEIMAWRIASAERQARWEAAAKDGPGSLSDKLTLARRMGLDQRMARQETGGIEVPGKGVVA